MSIHWNWRLASRLSVITMAVLVVIIVTLTQQNGGTLAGLFGAKTNTAALGGSDLGGGPAPDFRLTDQLGQQVALSQFKGKPVVLTFLYTNCPDACPLTAEKLHTTTQMLGTDAQHVGILAVSTDPDRDTIAAAQQFSKEHQMQNSWHYLVGTREVLTPIWSSYNIFAQSSQQSVSHSLGIYLIDKQGKERVFLGNDFTPTQLTEDLKTLLKE